MRKYIERTMQYIRPNQGFDDHFPCRKNKCKLKHVQNWFDLFTDFHNKELCLK
jgi:putative transposase